MKYYYKEKEITSKEQWKKAFCESYNSDGDDKHWKDGRSGERLAEDFIGEEPCGESTMIEMIRRFLGSKAIMLDNAKIEHSSVFDKHPRPRIQDLAIWGRADNTKLFVGVEAKVDEAFGSKSINQQRTYVNSLSKTEADKRLDELINDYLGGEEKSNGTLRYQLLYYLAGSFCEENADIVFMPVIVYKTNGKDYSPNKGKTNMRAYKRFMESLGFEYMEHVVGDQIVLAYHKRVSAHGFEKDVYSCYIIK